MPIFVQTNRQKGQRLESKTDQKPGRHCRYWNWRDRWEKFPCAQFALVAVCWHSLRKDVINKIWSVHRTQRKKSNKKRLFNGFPDQILFLTCERPELGACHKIHTKKFIWTRNRGSSVPCFRMLQTCALSFFQNSTDAHFPVKKKRCGSPLNNK